MAFQRLERVLIFEEAEPHPTEDVNTKGHDQQQRNGCVRRIVAHRALFVWEKNDLVQHVQEKKTMQKSKETTQIG